MKTIKLIRTYTTTFTFDVQTSAEAIELFDKIPSDEKYNQELEQMDVEEIVKVVEQKFARKCSATGIGINEGYVVYDGEEYFANKEDLINWLRNRNADEYNELSDEFLFTEAFENEEFYWTEWEDESDYQYELIDGKLIEIQ